MALCLGRITFLSYDSYTNSHQMHDDRIYLLARRFNRHSTLDQAELQAASGEASTDKSAVANVTPKTPDQKDAAHQEKNPLVATKQVVSDPRAKLKSWLGRVLRVEITDGRIIVGSFACTDREGNVILENACEYTKTSDREGRMLGLALVPGRHLVTIALMT